MSCRNLHPLNLFKTIDSLITYGLLMLIGLMTRLATISLVIIFEAAVNGLLVRGFVADLT
ncbi:hypothetical protein AQUSIP_07650 [Aquicella siphonis]|uniref:Uncharacterized protein n=1 Tax=Aquicella siphonis TaxID=254247 RepID=A0A5E4PFR6_9COXI|nr:hypothetical protein AQUSIP_07650 [Aquicella siphonis]